MAKKSNSQKNAQQFSLKKLTEMSQDVFQANPDENELLATSDGNFFTKKSKNFYQDHLNKGKEAGLLGYTIKRDGQEAAAATGADNTGTNDTGNAGDQADQ